ncbi:hypothetical protein MtrunA17_Chr7g0245721 [Medicago truncatula]|uniref:Transmembrane protein n=1 Tax=Medicago truncatula TaxID=3880 RepID=A0A396H072_MEDTR|nr:hypothetical protein MtrunA17_Chr7g0245721 [Medicago truncatula]
MSVGIWLNCGDEKLKCCLWFWLTFWFMLVCFLLVFMMYGGEEGDRPRPKINFKNDLTIIVDLRTHNRRA